MAPETREALERLERGLRQEIQGSAAETPRLIAESEDRMRGHLDVRLTESEDRTRRHFDVVAEPLRGDIRSLAEGIMAVSEGSMRRDAALGERIDRLTIGSSGSSRACPSSNGPGPVGVAGDRQPRVPVDGRSLKAAVLHDLARS